MGEHANTALLGELQGISQQVDQYLPNACWVALNLKLLQPRLCLQVQLQAPLLGAVLERAATEERPFMSSAVLVGDRGKKAALFMLRRLLELTPASVGGSLPTNEFWDMGCEE